MDIRKSRIKIIFKTWKKITTRQQNQKKNRYT